MRKIIFFLIFVLLVVPFVSAGFVDWVKGFFGDSPVTGYVAADGSICLVSDSIEEKLVIVEDNLDSLIGAIEDAEGVPVKSFFKKKDLEKKRSAKKGDVEVDCFSACDETSVCVDGECKIKEGESCLRKTNKDCATGFCSPTGFCEERFEPEERVVPPVADLVMNIQPDQDLPAGLTCLSSERNFITKAIFVHESYPLVGQTPNDIRGKLYLVGELDLDAWGPQDRFVNLGNYEAKGNWYFDQRNKPGNIQDSWAFTLSTGEIRVSNQVVLRPTLNLARRHTFNSETYETYFLTASKDMAACRLCDNAEGENDCFKGAKYIPDSRDDYLIGIVCKGSPSRPFNLAIFLYDEGVDLLQPVSGSSNGKLYLINNEGIEFEKKEDMWIPSNNFEIEGFYLKTAGIRLAGFSIPGPSINFLRNTGNFHEAYLLSMRDGDGNAMCKTCSGRLGDEYCFNRGVAS